MSKNYVQWVKRLLVEELGEEYACEDDLLDLYTLLVLTQGVLCDSEAVHDAWSVWTNNSAPQHQSLVPFSQLTPEIQAYDDVYRDAIRQAARRMLVIDGPTYEKRANAQ